MIYEFARREATKGLPDGRACRPEELNAVIRRLCVAALAMFNRGRQSITEPELSSDFEALESAEHAPSLAPGKRVLGEFFFVHTPEATVLGASDTSSSERVSHRAYEFLHATFGEYLVAYLVLDELRDLADQAYGSRRFRQPDDSKLGDLLSHQVLVSRPNVIDFLVQLFERLDETEPVKVRDALTLLCHNTRTSTRASSSTYRPTTYDAVRRIAAYTANLVTVRVAFQREGPVSLRDLVAEHPRSRAWSSLVSLWRAGLGTDGWYGMLSRLRNSRGEISLADTLGASISDATEAYYQAQLEGDEENAARCVFGLALVNRIVIPDIRSARDTLLARIFTDTLDIDTLRLGSFDASAQIFRDWPFTEMALSTALGSAPKDDSLDLLAAIERLLLTRQANHEHSARLIGVLQALDAVALVSPMVLLLNVCRFPELLATIPALADPDLYENARLSLLVMNVISPAHSGHSVDSGELRAQTPAQVGSKGLTESTRLWNRLHTELSGVLMRIRKFSRPRQTRDSS